MKRPMKPRLLATWLLCATVLLAPAAHADDVYTDEDSEYLKVASFFLERCQEPRSNAPTARRGFDQPGGRPRAQLATAGNRFRFEHRDAARRTLPKCNDTDGEGPRVRVRPQIARRVCRA